MAPRIGPLSALGFGVYLLWSAYGPWQTFYFATAMNFIFHEFGHGLTGMLGLGRLWVIAAGSFFEIMVPLGFALWGHVRGQPRLRGLSLVWAATALHSVSVYAADASARALPLAFFNNPNHHDWWNLLRAAGMLHRDQEVALAFWSAGLAVGLLGLWGLAAGLVQRPSVGASSRDGDRP